MKKPKIVWLGDLLIDLETHQVTKKNKKIPLCKKEFQLLEFFARNKNRVLNRLTIMEYVWNYNACTETNTLTVHIGALRKKLKKYNAHQAIQTIHGLGYKLNDSCSIIGIKDSSGIQ